MLLAVGIVDMLAGGEYLNRLQAAARQAIENARVKALFYKEIG
jgi:hypothetical protein